MRLGQKYNKLPSEIERESKVWFEKLMILEEVDYEKDKKRFITQQMKKANGR